MYKILTIILFITISFSAWSQISGTKVVRIANSTTAFSEALSEGNILIDLNTDTSYLILKGVAGTNSLSDLTENVDYKNISASEYQTLDIAQLNGTNLELSLSNDGESTHQISLGSLQDGTGTDDQTASEVGITDAGAYFVSTDVEGALQEIGGSIVSGGDDWGSDVVISDATLSGNGTSGSALKVDTTIIATLNDLNSGTEDAAFNTLNADTLNVQSITYSDSYWDDLQVNLSSVNLKNNWEPLWVDYKSGIILSFQDNDQDAVYFTAQLPHNYKHGSDISFHIHLVCPNGTSGNMDWIFTYTWTNIGDIYSDATSVNTQIATSGVTDKHFIGEFGTIVGTGKKGSSVIVCSLERDANSAESLDTYESDVYMVALDFHYQIDKPGSNNLIPDD